MKETNREANMKLRILQAKAEGFDKAVSLMQYSDGDPVEMVSVINPYREIIQALLVMYATELPRERI